MYMIEGSNVMPCWLNNFSLMLPRLGYTPYTFQQLGRGCWQITSGIFWGPLNLFVIKIGNIYFKFLFKPSFEMNIFLCIFLPTCFQIVLMIRLCVVPQFIASIKTLLTNVADKNCHKTFRHIFLMWNISFFSTTPTFLH